MIVYSEQLDAVKGSIAIFRFQNQFNIDPLHFLCPKELEYLNNSLEPKRRDQFLQTRYFLKHQLSEILKIKENLIEFKKTKEGKPVLFENPEALDFNISHSAEYCLIGISRSHFIGVDIEKIRTPVKIHRLAEKVLTGFERKSVFEISTLDQQAVAFTKLWATKESIVKAHASNILSNARAIEIDCNTWNINSLPADFGNKNNWDLYTKDIIPGYAISAAFKQR